MEWIDINDTTKQIPFTKVCIYDGGNTFWAWLQSINITANGRELIWNIDKPKDYGKCVPTHWMKIEYPK